MLHGLTRTQNSFGAPQGTLLATAPSYRQDGRNLRAVGGCDVLKSANSFVIRTVKKPVGARSLISDSNFRKTILLGTGGTKVFIRYIRASFSISLKQIPQLITITSFQGK